MSKRKNTNCMKGLRCPQCKQDAELLVWAEACVSLTDAGTDPYADSVKEHHGPEWNENSMAECPECDHEGTMATFEIANQRRKPAQGSGAPQPVRHACEYVCGTDIVPRRWDKWFWAQVSDNAPFSWGDNNHSLVTASDFARHCEERLDDSIKVKRWLKTVRALGETYIDLEN